MCRPPQGGGFKFKNSEGGRERENYRRGKGPPEYTYRANLIALGRRAQVARSMTHAGQLF